MDAGAIIIEVVKELFPWGEIVDAWKAYLDYKARIREIVAMERAYMVKAAAFTEYVRAQKELILARLQLDKEQSSARMRQLEFELLQKHNAQCELMRISRAISKRIDDSDGEERKAARDASLVIGDLLVQNTTAGLNLLSKNIDLQLRTIDLIDLRQIKRQLLE